MSTTTSADLHMHQDIIFANTHPSPLHICIDIDIDEGCELESDYFRDIHLDQQNNVATRHGSVHGKLKYYIDMICDLVARNIGMIPYAWNIRK
jgi:hypothetical protein